MALLLFCRYVQVSTLEPSSEAERSQSGPDEDPLPAHVHTFREHYNVKIFSYTRISKEHMSQLAEGGNEFRDMWTVRTFVETEHTMPSLQRRLRIVDSREVIICPVQNACETVRS